MPLLTLRKRTSLVTCCRSLLDSDEQQLVVHDSVAGCMCIGHGDGLAALYATVGDLNSHERSSRHELHKGHELVSLSGNSVEVCLTAMKTVAKATLRSHFRSEAQSRKDWIDSTTCELDRLTSTPETIDTPETALGRWGAVYCLQHFVALILLPGGSPRAASIPRVTRSTRLRCAGTLVGCYFMGTRNTESGTVHKTTFRWYFGRWSVHGKLQHRGWGCLRDCVVLELLSMASPRVSSAQTVALCPKLRCTDGDFTGNFSTEAGVVSKTACIADRVYAYKMADTREDGKCCQYGAYKLVLKQAFFRWEFLENPENDPFGVRD
jgi:hypothetical protein